MDRSTFDAEVEYAIQQGLPASNAIEFVSFLHKRFPEDLARHSSYYKQWLRRWKNEPLHHMDDECALLYSLILTTTDVFVVNV